MHSVNTSYSTHRSEFSPTISATTKALVRDAEHHPQLGTGMGISIALFPQSARYPLYPSFSKQSNFTNVCGLTSRRTKRQPLYNPRSPLFIHRDVSQRRLGHFDTHFLFRSALRKDFDIHRDRGTSDLDHVSIKTHYVAHKYRLAEYK